jgi:DNA-binding MarR family transcriptional regulator
MVSLPMSALVVLYQLITQGPLTPKQIRSRVKLSPRTVTNALKNLTDTSLCKRVANLHDMRQPLYHVDPAKMREMNIDFDFIRLMSTVHMKAL